MTSIVERRQNEVYIVIPNQIGTFVPFLTAYNYAGFCSDCHICPLFMYNS